jgi:hypothetical protein
MEEEIAGAPMATPLTENGHPIDLAGEDEGILEVEVEVEVEREAEAEAAAADAPLEAAIAAPAPRPEPAPVEPAADEPAKPAASTGTTRARAARLLGAVAIAGLLVLAAALLMWRRRRLNRPARPVGPIAEAMSMMSWQTAQAALAERPAIASGGDRRARRPGTVRLVDPMERIVPAGVVAIDLAALAAQNTRGQHEPLLPDLGGPTVPDLDPHWSAETQPHRFPDTEPEWALDTDLAMLPLSPDEPSPPRRRVASGSTAAPLPPSPSRLTASPPPPMPLSRTSPPGARLPASARVERPPTAAPKRRA